MSLQSELIAALKELEEFQGGTTLVFKSHHVPVVASMPSEEVAFDPEGNELRIATVLYARRSQWLSWGDTTITMGDTEFTMGEDHSAPGHGHIVLYPGAEGRKLRVIRLRPSPDGSHLELHLTDHSSNR